MVAIDRNGWSRSSECAHEGELNSLLRPYDRIYKPSEQGQFPLILSFHGCSGPSIEQEKAWASILNSEGYALVAVDSFKGRNANPQSVCQGNTLWGNERASDVYVSINHFMSQPWVNKSSISLMGFSHGAWSILDALAQPPGRLPDGLSGSDPNIINNVKFAIVFYPYCNFPAKHRNGWDRDTQILAVLAGADQVVSTAACQKIFDDQKSKRGFNTPVHRDLGASEGVKNLLR